MSECCEPSGVMVGALRDGLRELAHVEIPAGMARAILSVALMAEHERRDHEDPARNPTDPRLDR